MHMPRLSVTEIIGSGQTCKISILKAGWVGGSPAGRYLILMNSKNNELVTNLMNMMGCRRDVAEKYLSRANWDINRAVDIFFQENQGNS